MWEQVRRRHPRAELRAYDGSPFDVSRSRGDAIVVYCNDQPPNVPRGGVAGAMADLASGLVLVCVRDVRAFLRLRWDDPRLGVAIGRLIAHELEHVRRGSRAHDRRGWFRACARPEDLVPRAEAR